MRRFPKALLLGVSGSLIFAGLASASPISSEVKLLPEDRVAPRVATIFSTPLKKGETPFVEELEVSVTLPPEPEPEPEPEEAASRSGGFLQGEDTDVTATEAPESQSAETESSGESTGGDSTAAIYSLNDLMFQGVINWGGYKFTYYSQSVLPGGGLSIPGRHVSDDGYVVDGDGYIALAGSAPMGTVYPTPFGRSGKIYDRGTSGNHLDVYTR